MCTSLLSTDTSHISHLIAHTYSSLNSSLVFTFDYIAFPVRLDSGCDALGVVSESVLISLFGNNYKKLKTTHKIHTIDNTNIPVLYDVILQVNCAERQQHQVSLRLPVIAEGSTTSILLGLPSFALLNLTPVDISPQLASPKIESQPPHLVLLPYEADPTDIRELERKHAAINDPLWLEITQTADTNLTEHGATIEERNRLKQLLDTYQSSFRMQLPPNHSVAHVAPWINIRKPEAPTATFVAARPVAPLARPLVAAALQEQRLLGNFRTPASLDGVRDISPYSPILKSPTELRPVIDARVTNHNTIQVKHIERPAHEILHQVTGKRMKLTFDILSAYDQVNIATQSLSSNAIMTQDGVLINMHAIQGHTNSAAALHHLTRSVFGKTNAILKADDGMCAADTITLLLDEFEDTMKAVKHHNLILKTSKLSLCPKIAHWYGYCLADNTFYRHSKSYKSILELPTPATAYELSAQLGAFNYFRNHIPHYLDLTTPLQDLYKECARAAASSTTIADNTIQTNKQRARTHKSFLNRIKLVRSSEASVATTKTTCFEWQETHEEAHKTILKALANRMSLYLPLPSDVFILTTDASNTGLAHTLTAIDPDQLHLPLLEMDHRPIAMSCCKWTDAQMSWSAQEKEMYATVHAVLELHHLLDRPPPQVDLPAFFIYTDNRNNHINLSTTTGITADAGPLGHPRRQRLERWRSILLLFNYESILIPTDVNVWADVLSRITILNNDRPLAKEDLDYYDIDNDDEIEDDPLSTIIADLSHSQTTTTLDTRVAAVRTTIQPALTLPHLSLLQEAQRNYFTINPSSPYLSTLKKDEVDTYRNKKNAIFIPPDALDIHRACCYYAHNQRAGHRKARSMQALLQSHVTWPSLIDDVHSYCDNCIACLMSKPPTIPHHLVSTQHGAYPHDLAVTDFFYVPAPSTNGENAIVAIKDDASGHIYLQPVPDFSALSFVSAALSYFARYRRPKAFLSDNARSFTNFTIEEFTKLTGTRLIHGIPNTPHTDGTIERSARDVSFMMKALLIELQLPLNHWPSTLPLIESAINHGPTTHLHGHTPAELFIGCEPDNPFAHLQHQIAAISSSSSEATAHITHLCDYIHNLHQHVQPHKEARRAQGRASHNKKNLVQAVPTYTKGTTVLFSSIPTNNNIIPKGETAWKGPAVIDEQASRSSYYLYYLDNPNTRFLTHVDHIQPYHANAPAPPNPAPTLTRPDHTIEKIEDFISDTSSIANHYFRVRWRHNTNKNLSETTLELPIQIWVSYPQLLSDYLYKHQFIKKRPAEYQILRDLLLLGF